MTSLRLAAIGGALAGACWLPFGAAPLFPLAMLAALRGLRRVETRREAIRFGIVFAAARYAVAAHFLLALWSYSPLAIVLYALAILFILPFGILESWGAFALERRLGLPRAAGFGLLYALGGWLRTLGDLSFPADRLAHAFGTAPAWLAASPWIGPFGLELLVFASAALADLAIDSRGNRPRAVLLASGAAAIWLAPVAVDAIQPRRSDGPALRVGIVQPAIPLADKVRKERWGTVWERLERLTLEASAGADLVIWPETARPSAVIWEGGGPFRDREMEALAARVGVPILYGCEIARRDGGRLTALHNGAALAWPDGRPSTWYGKQHLLPFVEGVPFARRLGWHSRRRAAGDRESLLTLLGAFTAGPDPPLFEVGSAKIGVMICFEGMYPELARRYRDAGANLLVVLTNDAWWGRSVFPKWHAGMIATRARECSLPVVRAANHGISSTTGADGRMQDATRLGESIAFPVSVPLQGRQSTLARR